MCRQTIWGIMANQLFGNLKEVRKLLRVPTYGTKYSSFDRLFQKKPKNPV
tara:strand:- start:2693 stop:2842 length:150 start_codon:yes stop_codon:yes gene_type:complete